MSERVTPVESSRPRRRVGAIVLDVALIAVLLVLLPETLQLSGTARRFPLLTLGLTLVLLIVDLVVELRPSLRESGSLLYGEVLTVGAGPRAEGTEEEDEAAPLEEPPDPTRGEPPRARREAWAIGWMVIGGLGMYLWGYVVITPVLMVGMYLWARVSPKVWIPITVVMSGFNYFAFYEFLGLR